jgi:glycine/D-amino acid oxidase-like deaminating enzyme
VSAHILQKGLATVFPSLAGTPIDFAWSGNVCFTPDLLPRAGQLDGIHYAMGYGGHGVALATYMGFVMAGEILGHKGENPFEGFSFPPLPLYSGRPWFLPVVGGYYALKDLVQ